MWCLEEHEGRYVYILPGRKVSFGKSLSNIKIEGDATISRLHAIVSTELLEESELQHKCVICDVSKYGTYILRDKEKKRLPKDEKFVLKPGDKVQFGLKHSIFTVIHYSFMVVMSSLNKDEVDEMRHIINDLGGTLSNNWTVSCTHLTVPDRFLFTTKLACALASASMIVTIAYWEAIMKAVEENKKLPKINDFLPIVNEEWLYASTKLFLPKEERKTLFRGLYFVHFTAKQYTSYKSIITAAGGKSCIYPTKKPLTPRDLMANNAVIIQQPANDSSQFTVQTIATDYPIIHHKLSALKRRMISDSEIPLAILYCSTEKFCNPKFNFGTLLKSNTQMFFSSGVVIVEDTQDVPSTSNKRKPESKEQQRIIPETVDSQYDSDTSKKARYCPENKEKDVSGNINSGSDIVCLFSSKDTKQPTIIPETCDSLDKSVANNNFFQNSTKNPNFIPESCDKNSVLQENVEIQQQEEIILVETNNSTLKKHNLIFEEDDPVFEDNNITFKKSLTNNMTLQKKKLSSEKSNPLKIDNLANPNDESENESWKSSKGPRIVSIEKISNGNNVCTNRITGKVLEKDRFKIEKTSDFQVKLRDERDKEVEILDVNKEDKRKEEKSRTVEATKMKIEKRDENREEKPRKMRTDWYENYLGHEFTDKILRKDAPCGKKFVKALVPVPARKLRSDDFVL